jgi:hypothetical protein
MSETYDYDPDPPKPRTKLIYSDAVDNNPVHEAMLSYWGERCPDYHKECVCCQAWEQYDNMTDNQGEMK